MEERIRNSFRGARPDSAPRRFPPVAFAPPTPLDRREISRCGKRTPCLGKATLGRRRCCRAATRATAHEQGSAMRRAAINHCRHGVCGIRSSRRSRVRRQRCFEFIALPAANLRGVENKALLCRARRSHESCHLDCHVSDMRRRHGRRFAGPGRAGAVRHAALASCLGAELASPGRDAPCHRRRAQAVGRRGQSGRSLGRRGMGAHSRRVGESRLAATTLATRTASGRDRGTDRPGLDRIVGGVLPLGPGGGKIKFRDITLFRAMRSENRGRFCDRFSYGFRPWRPLFSEETQLIGS